jgi:hypothetical protein
VRTICGIIVTVAEHTPHLAHWLPSREASAIAAVRREFGSFPDNLAVRVSAPMIDGKPPRGSEHTSVVYTGEPPEEAFACPSRQQENTCGGCRRCWGAEPVVTYRRH